MIKKLIAVVCLFFGSAVSAHAAFTYNPFTGTLDVIGSTSALGGSGDVVLSSTQTHTGHKTFSNGLTASSVTVTGVVDTPVIANTAGTSLAIGRMTNGANVKDIITVVSNYPNEDIIRSTNTLSIQDNQVVVGNQLNSDAVYSGAAADGWTITNAIGSRNVGISIAPSSQAKDSFVNFKSTASSDAGGGNIGYNANSRAFTVDRHINLSDSLTVVGTATIAGQSVCLADGTDCPASGAGDMILASTQTVSGQKVHTSTRSLVVQPSGSVGVSIGSTLGATSGAFIYDASLSTGPGVVVYNNAGQTVGSANSMMTLVSTNTTYGGYFLRMFRNDSNSNGETRYDSPNPNDERCETDQAAGTCFETGINDGVSYWATRNSANTSFERVFNVPSIASGAPGITILSTGSIKLSDTAGSTIGFKSPNTLGASWTHDLWSTSSNSGKVLEQATDSGTRALQWSNSFGSPSSSVTVRGDLLVAQHLTASSITVSGSGPSLYITAHSTPTAAPSSGFSQFYVNSSTAAYIQDSSGVDHRVATSTGTLTPGNVPMFDNNGNLVDSGGTGGGTWDPTAHSDTGYFLDEFPCKGSEDGELGMLGWPLINTVTTTGCGNNLGGNTGVTSFVVGSGNTACGIALARVSATGSGVLADPINTDFEMQARVKFYDSSEVIYKVGLGNEVATETADAFSTNQGFIGVTFKNETTDTGGECGGTVFSSTTINAISRTGANSSGPQDTSVIMDGSTYLWVRIKNTDTPGVQICLDQTNSAPTYPASGCYEETNTSNIPTGNVSPFFIASSCDNSTLSGNSNRYDIDYFGMKVSRY